MTTGQFMSVRIWAKNGSIVDQVQGLKSEQNLNWSAVVKMALEHPCSDIHAHLGSALTPEAL